MMTNPELRLTILRTANTLRRKTDHILLNIDNKDKLSLSNIQIMGYISRDIDKVIYQKNIEEFFSLRPSTVSANLKLLEQKGYITRVYSTEDTRLKRVMPTQKAIELEKIMRTRVHKIEDRINKILSDQEQKMLYEILSKLDSNLE